MKQVRIIALAVAMFCSAAVFAQNSNMVYVAGGTFQMGSKDGKDYSPVHSVSVSDFYMSRNKVTIDIFERFAVKIIIGVPPPHLQSFSPTLPKLLRCRYPSDLGNNFQTLRASCLCVISTCCRR